MQDSTVRKVLVEISDMVVRGDKKDLILKYINGVKDTLYDTCGEIAHPTEPTTNGNTVSNINVGTQHTNNGAKPILG